MNAPPTPRVTPLAVVRFADGWRLLSQGRRWGRFASRAQAEAAALRLAAGGRAMGRPVELLVQQPYGELRRLDGARG